jgi:hypothetical protein
MRKQRTLVPRTMASIARQMDPTRDDTNRRGVPPNNICINPNLKDVRYETLRSYTGGKTVLRVWPMLDPEDPSNRLLNGRLSTVDMAGLGGMSISEPAYCVQFAGIKRDTPHFGGNSEFTQISYIIGRNKSSVYEGVSFWNEPYVKLYTTVKKAFEGRDFGYGGVYDPRWNSLMSAKMPALGPFRQQYFVVASVYENGGGLDLTREHISYKQQGQDVIKDIPRNGIPLGEGEKDSLVVVALSVSAGRNLLKLCCIEKQDWTGDVNANPSIMFKYGDPTGIFDAKTGTVKGGLFFTIYNPTKEKIDKHTTFSGAAGKAAVEYEVAVSTKYQGPQGILTPDLNNEQVDRILSKNVFLWKENAEDPADSYLLHEPTIEERCVMIARAFRQVPKLLEFGWMSHPEYLNYESVAAILNRKTTSVVASTEEEDFEDEVPAKPKVSPMVKPKVVAAKASVTNSSNPGKSPSGNKSVSELVDDFEDTVVDEDKLEDEELDDEFDDSAHGDEVSKSKGSKLKKDDEFDDEFNEDELEDEDSEDEADPEEGGEDSEDEDSEDDEDFVDEDEESKSKDFDEEANETLNDQLNNSLAKAKGLARSRKRVAPPAAKEAPAPSPASKKRPR